MARPDHRTLILSALALAPGNAMATTAHTATHPATRPVAAAPAHAAPRHAAAQAAVHSAPPRAGAAAYAAPVGAQGWNRGWHGDSRYDWAAWRANHREIYRLGYYYPPLGDYAYVPIGDGGLLDAAFMAEQFWIADPSIYHLPPVWGPYRWIRYYNDALLVDIDTGQVVDVVRAIFL